MVQPAPTTRPRGGEGAGAAGAIAHHGGPQAGRDGAAPRSAGQSRRRAGRGGGAMSDRPPLAFPPAHTAPPGPPRWYLGLAFAAIGLLFFRQIAHCEADVDLYHELALA